MTLEDLGALLGFTRERVRQLESKALEHFVRLAAASGLVLERRVRASAIAFADRSPALHLAQSLNVDAPEFFKPEAP